MTVDANLLLELFSKHAKSFACVGADDENDNDNTDVLVDGHFDFIAIAKDLSEDQEAESYRPDLSEFYRQMAEHYRVQRDNVDRCLSDVVKIVSENDAASASAVVIKIIDRLLEQYR